MKRIALALVFALALVSCEKQIPFPDDETTPLVVFSAVAEPDSTLTATLSFSRFFLSNHSFRSIHNAQLTLRVGSQTYTATHQGDGLYSFGSFRPQPGDSLVLDGSVLNYAVLGDEPARIHAATRVPLRPEAQALSCTPAGSRTYNLRLQLQDRPHERNCYGLRVRYVDTVERVLRRETYDYQLGRYVYDTIVDTTAYDRYCTYQIKDILIVEEDNSALGAFIDGDIEEMGQGEYYGNSLLFADDRIDGTAHTLSLEVYTYNSYYGGGYYDDSYYDDGYYYQVLSQRSLATATFFVDLVALSPEYYRYLLSCDKQYDMDDLGGLFAEPVVIQCNVQGGIGCLGAQSTTRIEVPVQLSR